MIITKVLIACYPQLQLWRNALTKNMAIKCYHTQNQDVQIHTFEALGYIQETS